MTKVTIEHIAGLVNGKVEGDSRLEVAGVRPFDEAGADDITCALSAKYTKMLSGTSAGAVIVPMDAPSADATLVRVTNPDAAFARVIALFYPPAPFVSGIAPGVFVGVDFVFGENVSISSGVVVGNNVRLGSNVRLMPNVVLGDNVVIGSDVVVYPNVSILERCEIGDHVIIHAGTVIGSDGYGFAPDGEKYIKKPQTGIVRISSNVEIGANNTIDRAAFGQTWIKSGVKTDNLVHVGHNVVVGENTLLVAQVGISGSTTIGKHVILAGQAGVRDHVSIGDYAIVGPKTGVAKSIGPGQVMSGTPAMPHSLWLRVQRVISNLPGMAKDIRSLNKRVKKLEDLKP